MAAIISQGKSRIHFYDQLSLSLRAFKTRPVRTFLTVLGMAFGVGVVLFLVSLGFGLQKILLGNLISTEDSLVTLEVYYPPESGLKFYQKNIEEIREMKDAEEISAVAEFPAEIRFGGDSGMLVARIVDDAYFRLAGHRPPAGQPEKKNPAAGKSGSGKKEITLTAAALKLINAPAERILLDGKIGVSIFYPETGAGKVPGEVKIVNIEKNRPSEVIEDENEPPLIYLQAAALPPPPYFERLLVKSANIEGVEGLKNLITDKGLSVSAKLDLVTQTRKILTAITVILGIFGVASLIVSAIGMMNTMLIGFLERTYEVGIMKALGAKNSDIKNLFLMESLTMGFLGGVGGIVIGLLGGALFNFGLNILAKRLGGKPIELFVNPFWFMLIIVAISSLIGIVSGIIPARRAARLSPKEAFTRK